MKQNENDSIKKGKGLKHGKLDYDKWKICVRAPKFQSDQRQNETKLKSSNLLKTKAQYQFTTLSSKTFNAYKIKSGKRFKALMSKANFWRNEEYLIL